MSSSLLAVLALPTAVAFAGGEELQDTPIAVTVVSDAESLHSRISFEDGADIDIGALIRSSYANVDKDLFDENALGLANQDEDFNGWSFQDLDIWLQGGLGQFDWRLSLDFDDEFNDVNPVALYSDNEAVYHDAFTALLDRSLIGNGDNMGYAKVQDAYIEGSPCGSSVLRWGQFKPNTFLSSQSDPERGLFLNRSFLGSIFDTWDTGVEGRYLEDEFGVYGSITNGLDGGSSDGRYTLRGEYFLNQEDGARNFRRWEGARWRPDDLTGVIGAVYTEDQSLSDAVGDRVSIYGLDAGITSGKLSAQAEIGWTGEGLGDANPFSLQAGYLLDQKYELALRYGQLDNDADTRAVEAALNIYYDAVRTTVQFSNFDANGGMNGNAIMVGISLGGSRP